MLRLARFLVLVEGVHKDASTNIKKRVSGLFLLPSVILSKLLVECFIRCQERLIFLNNRNLFRLYVKESGIELNGDARPFDLIACVNQCLRYVGCVRDGG